MAHLVSKSCMHVALSPSWVEALSRVEAQSRVEGQGKRKGRQRIVLGAKRKSSGEESNQEILVEGIILFQSEQQLKPTNNKAIYTGPFSSPYRPAHDHQAALSRTRNTC